MLVLCMVVLLVSLVCAYGLAALALQAVCHGISCNQKGCSAHLVRTPLSTE
jgi:hypothetical protein